MELFKMKPVVSSLLKDLPCLLCLSVFLASVTLHVTAVEEESKGGLQSDQTSTFSLAKRSKDNQHKFGWGKRSRSSRIVLDEDMFDKRATEGIRYATVTDTLCKQGAPGCTFTKMRIPYHRSGLNGYGKRSLQDDEEDEYEGQEERNELDADSMEARANDDRNGWGGNYGRDLEDSSELRAMLSARKRVYDMDKRHGNGWNGAYGKRSRIGRNSAYAKKKRSVSE